ncbi:MAG: class I SAM-dependent methyltransferase [Myxococcota bacterium]
MPESRYAFGDSDTAAQRLATVARVFDPPSRAFLGEWKGAGCGLALDLGCGPGFTTELVDAVLAPERTVGIDASQAFVDAASARAPRLAFLRHDVLDLPFPTGPADLVYARFLVSHLADPARALAGWRSALAPGGRLLLDEVEAIDTACRVFGRYLALVEAVLAERGQCLFVGPRLEELAAGLEVASSTARTHPVDPRDAARMFALNLATLRPDDRALAAELEAIARDGGPPITWTLRQLVVGARS